MMRTWSCACRPSPSRSMCDPERVAQVLRILIDNAIIHTPPGTDLVVSASRRGDRARLGVGDFGPGIHRTMLPRIFEPFVTSDDAQGSGPRARDRRRAGRADGRPAGRRLPAGAHDLHAGAARMRRLAAGSSRAGRGVALALAAAGCGRAVRGAETSDDHHRPAHHARRGRQAGADADRPLRPAGDLPARLARRRDDPVGLRPRRRARGAGAGLGSGFVISASGEIATNAHVVTTGEGAAIRKARQALRPLRRRQPGRGDDRRLRPVLRRRADQGRPQGTDAAPAGARLERRRQGRRAGRRDRLAVRRGALAVDRRRVGHRPRDRVAHRLSDHRRAADRRGDQQRQLGRAAARRRRPRAGDQLADPLGVGVGQRRRLRRLGRRRAPLPGASCAATGRSATPTWACRPRASTRSWPRASRSGPPRGAWSSRS